MSAETGSRAAVIEPEEATRALIVLDSARPVVDSIQGARGARSAFPMSWRFRSEW